MNKKDFWASPEKDPDGADSSEDQIKYLLLKENESLRQEVDILREQLFETKTELSRLRMLIDMISSVIQDNVQGKLDFIKEIINNEN